MNILESPTCDVTDPGGGSGPGQGGGRDRGRGAQDHTLGLQRVQTGAECHVSRHVTCHVSYYLLQTPCHDMVTNLGGVTITQAMSYAIDWEAAFR